MPLKVFPATPTLVKHNLLNHNLLKRNPFDHNLFKHNHKEAMRRCLEYIGKIPETLKSQSIDIVRSCARQCECVAAQRLRRGQQMFALYSRLWEERALREFARRMRQQVARRGAELLLGAVGVSAYDWDRNRIGDDEVARHASVEFDYVRTLRCRTMSCRNCDAGGAAVRPLPCGCPAKAKSYDAYDDWKVFIEKSDMIVWRRSHASGSYEYKVYGSFDDVRADDFLNVQIDIDYRKRWDTTAVSLDVLEKDPNTSCNGDVIYWEMYWPKLFSNRDYVFKRRFVVDARSKTLVLVSKGTEHPKRPVAADKYRVSDYRSHMVIRPHRDFFEPGLEFSLTYYDNPGVNIPAAVTAWVAYRAMPDFLAKLRVAARDYHGYCLRNGIGRRCDLRRVVDDEETRLASERVDGRDGIEGKLICLERAPKPEVPDRIPGVDIMTSPSPIVQADVSKHSYWKYLRPTYYFS